MYLIFTHILSHIIIREGYKYRYNTGVTERQQFAQHAGACRFVWNKILATNEASHISGTPRIGFADGCKYLTLWKQSDEYGFLADIHSQALHSRYAAGPITRRWIAWGFAFMTL